MAKRTACTEQAKGSANAASTKDKSSGRIVKFCALIATFSANAPGTRMPINSRFAHKCSLPDTQGTQAPHVINGLMATRCPCSGPSSATPTASCPKTNGGTRRSSWPCQACISDPQMPQNAKSTTTCSLSQTGVGTSRISDNCVPV